MAEKRGYVIRVMVFPNRGFKNTHDVPPDKVQSMWDRMDLEPGVYTWSSETHYVHLYNVTESLLNQETK